MSAMTAADVTAWSQALDALEADLAETNLLLDGSLDEVAPLVLRRATAWRVPQGLGPMPTELSERATAVLTRQRETAARLARALSATKVRTRILDARPDRARPVYLDAEG